MQIIINYPLFFIIIFLLYAPAISLGEGNYSVANDINVQTEKEDIALPTSRSVKWTSVDAGLSYFVKELPLSEGDVFAVIKVDPKKYKFSLHMASEEGNSLPLQQWAETHGLDAAINASMYLPDNITSIGYMQSSTHINNRRVGGKLGAFFVAEPFDESFPFADILEKEDPLFQETLEKYTIQVQNFRIMTKLGQILWSSDGREYSIAAVAKDTSGNILFALCQKPMTGAAFAKYLLSFELSLSSIIYVEGGEKAAIFLKTKNGSTQWVGRKSLFNFKGDPLTAIPNIIGIKKR